MKIFTILRHTYFKIERKREKERESERTIFAILRNRVQKTLKFGVLNTLRTAILIKMRFLY